LFGLYVFCHAGIEFLSYYLGELHFSSSMEDKRIAAINGRKILMEWIRIRSD
jgi:hypothetical protein